jgi:hypothetical protein
MLRDPHHILQRRRPGGVHRERAALRQRLRPRGQRSAALRRAATRPATKARSAAPARAGWPAPPTRPSAPAPASTWRPTARTAAPCGTACASGEVCASGACALSCPLRPDRVRRRVLRHPERPGPLRRLRHGLRSRGGLRGPAPAPPPAPPARPPCAGQCYDTRSARAHCGACGVACDPGEACSGGQLRRLFAPTARRPARAAASTSAPRSSTAGPVTRPATRARSA